MPISFATTEKLTDILDEKDCVYHVVYSLDDTTVLAIHWTQPARQESGVITDRTLVSDLPEFLFD